VVRANGLVPAKHSPGKDNALYSSLAGHLTVFGSVIYSTSQHKGFIAARNMRQS